MTKYKRNINVWNADAFHSNMRALPSNSRRGLCPRTPTLTVDVPRICSYAGADSSVVPHACQGSFAAYSRRPENRRLRYSTISLTGPEQHVSLKSCLNNQYDFESGFHSIFPVKEEVVQRCFILKQRILFQRCFLLTHQGFPLAL